MELHIKTMEIDQIDKVYEGETVNYLERDNSHIVCLAI